MPKAYETWTVHPHEPIQELDTDLWTVRGSLPNMGIGRVMTVVRRPDGGLLVHNPIALDDASMARLDAWGPVGTIVVPIGWHRLDSRMFRERYPAASLLCPRGSRKQVEQVVPVGGDVSSFPSDAQVDLAHLDGTREAECVMTVRSPGGATLVFADAVFNLAHMPGFTGLIVRLMGSSGGPRCTAFYKLAAVRDRPAFRAHLDRLAATPDLRRIVVAHGAMITDDPAGVLRRVAAGV